MQIVLKGLIIGQDSYNDDVLYKENSSSPYSSGIGSTIQERIENRDGVKNFCDYENSLGTDSNIIEDCSIRLYFMKEECTLEEADTALVDKLFGVFEVEKELTGYSEFTITGYDINKCEIGGHNLLDIILSHKDEYMILVMEW